MYRRSIVVYVVSILYSISLLYSSHIALAETVNDLQSKIDQRNQAIVSLEKEIANYQKEINELSAHASTLSATLKSLQLTQKKLEADIKITENKIIEKNIVLQLLGSQISDKEDTIINDRKIIARSYASINELDTRSIPEILLAEKSLSSAWNALDNIGMLQQSLISRIYSLQDAKTNLEINKKSTEKAKTELLNLGVQLKNQRSVVLNTTNEQKQLLTDTKQSEAKYQSLLAEKKTLKDSFEREVQQFEAQLKLTIDPASIPHTGSGVLQNPLDNIFITQYFGNTPFATANSQIYNGKGHTGIDFRASIGTPVRAALSGSVIGVYNTDLVRGCYSYGKWIMIKHNNGLSTLYAHLSLQTVTIGQQVGTGQIIGYSGNTGYSTGPHLHFGVYATEGVQITKMSSSINCRNATIPLADIKAYLNPLSYL